MDSKAIPVRVAVRIRPLSSKEHEEGCQSVVKVIDNRPQIYISSMEKAFTFDFAFPDGSTQLRLYDESVSPMINKLFEGFNATVLAYGQTGSGKTYTMGTTYSEGVTTDNLAGVIPRSVKDIFEIVASKAEELDVIVEVSFIELYKEQLFDLLSSKSSRKEDCLCELREDPLKGVVIPDLTFVRVESVSATMNQLMIGSQKRVTASTAMNNVSSRSHAIFTVNLTMVPKNDAETSTVSKFHLVDLAGSERASKTKATGNRFQEGIKINEGLLALGNVISALGEENSKHIPYRNSKLTRLLQDSLGGNSHTLMISCVGPSDSNVDETVSTLRYSDRARKIKNKPIINVGANDNEVWKLKSEIQTLKLQLLQSGGDLTSKQIDAEEIKQLKDSNKRLKEENKELTGTLMACQEELTHLNEKMVLEESSNETLKSKIKQALANIEDDPGNLETPEFFKSTLRDLLVIQADSEKLIVDHDYKRVDQSSLSETDNLDDEDNYSIHAKKQTALTTKLNNLNKALAQKEKLAADMNDNDEKFQIMRKSFEKSLKNLENEMAAIQKERDELAQQHRSAASDPSSKISEQRKKKIQELEHKLAEMKKKILEQQKAIKLNEKNEAKVKKLAEEILQMKQIRVKLIKQMKEDAEKLRVFKQEKEKEVRRLKQTERKQQVQIAKMETLHTKQQNVLKRKLEEAVHVNKRLKEVMDRQKACSASNPNKTLVGSGERVRSWINGEMEVVVSVKEAMKSHEELLNDRKILMKELNKLKKDLRDTMSREEMEECQHKLETVQSDLDVRNTQILQLQKQISESEQDASGKGRFESLKSLVEAKIALEHLFQKSVEQTLDSTQVKSEFDELKQLYDECVKNTNNLEKEISDIKNDYETKLIKTSRDHEEKVLFLLGKLQNSSQNERQKIHEEEIEKYSKLNEELMKMGEENERLRKQMSSAHLKPKPQKKEKVERYTLDEFHEIHGDSESEEDYENAEDDPDWQKTPLFKRIKKLRELSNVSRKRKGDEFSTENLSESPPASKRFSGNTSKAGCNCKKLACGSKRCPCKKNMSICNDSCGCLSNQCRNRHEALTDITSSSNNDTANTASLLDDTYSRSILRKPEDSFLHAGLKSPLKPNSNATYFKSPLLEDNLRL